MNTAATEMQRLREKVVAAENTKSLLQEMRKKSEEDKASCQRERDEIQEQRNRLREELRSATATQANTHGELAAGELNLYKKCILILIYMYCRR